MSKKRSLVWLHFTNLSSEKAECNLCKKIISYKGGTTTNLNKHLRSKHPTIPIKKRATNSSIQLHQESRIISNRSIMSKKRSLVWLHFTSLSSEKAKCNLCKNIFSYKGKATSNLNKHLRSKHPTIPIKKRATNSITTQALEHLNLNSNLHQASRIMSNRSIKSKKRSLVWLHFTSLSSEKAKCNLCKNIFSYKGRTTGNLNKHLRSKHPIKIPIKKRATNSNTTQALEQHEDFEDFSDSISSIPTHAGSSTMSSRNTSQQTTLSNFVTKPITLNRQKNINNYLLEMIVNDLQPFAVVEDKGFKNLIKFLEPAYDMPSRQTITKSLLPQKYDETKSKVQALLTRTNYINLTTDGWTSAAKESYVGITAHFITDDWVLHSVLIQCVEFSERHTAVNLSEDLQRVVIDWNINEKVFCIVSDNAANIVAAINRTPWKHIRCFAHSLNLVTEKGLDEIKPILKKVKQIVEYFHWSTAANSNLLATQKQLKENAQPLKLKNDVSKWWNSSYYMLERIFAIREAVTATITILDEPIGQLTQDEWTCIGEALNVLKPLEQIAVELSAEKNVFISKVIPLIHGLKSVIEKSSGSTAATQLAITLLKLLNERFQAINSDVDYSIAIFLDPRFRIKGLQIEETMESWQSAQMKIEEELVALINRKLSLDLDMNQDVDTNARSKSDLVETLEKELVWEYWDNMVCSTSGEKTASAIATLEINKYLDETNISRKENPLQWWKIREQMYPNLSKLAQKYLSVPATSVPCERIFSKAGQIISEKRNRLKRSYVNTLLFLNHNKNV